jgi:hypothetical protein
VREGACGRHTEDLDELAEGIEEARDGEEEDDHAEDSEVGAGLLQARECIKEDRAGR